MSAHTRLSGIFSMITAALALLSLASCTADEPSTDSLPPLVVEGWIEEGAHPIVIVTRAVDMTLDTPSFDDKVEKWCRVSISDGETRYYLTGTIDNAYTPSFIYTTNSLTGKAGTTYSLLIETENGNAAAQSTLPESKAIAALEAVPSGSSDTLFSIKAHIDSPKPDACYKFFTRSFDTESRYYPAFLGTFKGCDYPSEGYDVTRGIHSGYENEQFSHYFKPGERVTVKLCTLQPEIFQFWKTYDNNVSLSQNLFFTFAENCPGNISGALGYWAAYGMSRRSLTIPEKKP